MEVRKGFNLGLLFLTISFLLQGCSSGSGSTDPSSFSLSAEPTYSGIDSLAFVDQLSLSNSVTDYVYLYEFANTFYDDIDFIQSILSGYYTYEPIVECENGGLLRLDSTKAENNWRFKFYYSNCKDNGVTRNGKVVYSFPGFSEYISSNNVSVLFDYYKVKFSDGDSVKFYGAIDVLNTQNPFRLKTNLYLWDNEKLSVKTEDLLFGTSYREGQETVFTGRMHYPSIGYFDVKKVNGFDYISEQNWPNKSGFFEIEGLNGVGRQETISEQKVWLQIEDGSGIAGAKLAWRDLLINALPESGQIPLARSEDQTFTPPGLWEADAITLDGSESLDAEKSLLKYSWRIITGPEGHDAKLESALEPVATLLPNKIGLYEIELVVSDGVNQSEPAIISVLIDSDGYDPVPDFNASQNLLGTKSGRIVTSVPINFDASESRAYAAVTLPFIDVSYSWRLSKKPVGSNAELSNSSEALTDFIPDLPGQYEVRLSVNDGASSSNERIISIQAWDYDTDYRPRVSLKDMPFGYTNTPIDINTGASSTVGMDGTSVSWNLVSSPIDSTPTTPLVEGLGMSFLADKPGTYRFEVKTSNDFVDSLVSLVDVYVMANENLVANSVFLESDFEMVDGLLNMPIDIDISDLNQDGVSDITFPIGPYSGSQKGYKQITQLKSHLTTEEFIREDYLLSDEKQGVCLVEDFNLDTVNEVFMSDWFEWNIYDDVASMSLEYTKEHAGARPSQDSLIIDDINSDLFKDIVYIERSAASQHGSTLEILRNSAGLDINFSENESYLLDKQFVWNEVLVEDIFGDGKNDIVLVGFSEVDVIDSNTYIEKDRSSILVLEQKSDGTLDNARELDIERIEDYVIKSDVVLSDIDMDGDTDLVAVIRSKDLNQGGGIGYWFQESGVFRFGGTLLNGSASDFTERSHDGSRHLLTHDMDSDGMMEIILFNNNYLSVFYHNSKDQYDRGQSYSLDGDEHWHPHSAIELVDLDFDEDNDILIVMPSSNYGPVLQLINNHN